MNFEETADECLIRTSDKNSKTDQEGTDSMIDDECFRVYFISPLRALYHTFVQTKHFKLYEKGHTDCNVNQYFRELETVTQILDLMS